MSRIVVLGGTFNPLSKAHDLILREGMRKVGAKKALLLPTGDGFLLSWKKYDSASILPTKLRMSILKEYVRRHKDILLDDMEIVGKSKHTVTSLRLLRGKYPKDQFYFLLGSEKIDEILTWKDARELLGENLFLMARRNEDDLSALVRKEAVSLFPGHFQFFDPGEKSQQISSTKIRELLRKGDFSPMKEWTFSYVIRLLKEAQER